MLLLARYARCAAIMNCCHARYARFAAITKPTTTAKTFLFQIHHQKKSNEAYLINNLWLFYQKKKVLQEGFQ